MDNTGNANQQENRQYNNRPGGYGYPYGETRNGFATASLVLGICALLSICTLFLPLPLGALSILFAILSRRQHRKLAPNAIAGLITSIISVVMGLAITIYSLVSAFALLKPENREYLNSVFEQTYGMDFDEYMENLYGEDFDDYFNQLEDMYR